jgi:hypothetical protein
MKLMFAVQFLHQIGNFLIGMIKKALTKTVKESIYVWIAI